jgi:2-desacetyl-2-hydroxyethyl bacteriochlorophyllide A dehydrogenase
VAEPAGAAREGGVGIAAAAASVATMRAARLAGQGTLRVEAARRPEPGPGEVLVRLEGCGVCGSNLPVWEGREWFDYPLPPGAPGHEGWGVVAALGDGAEGVAVGDRVCLLSERAFAEYDVAPADRVVRLPPELGGEPFPGEALGCALNVLARSDVHAGQEVAVVGIGFLGALLVQLSARAGARVTAFSRRPFALEVARTCGADEARRLDDAPDRLFERVVEAAGVQETLDLAARLAAVRGRLVIAGYHQDGPRTVDLRDWNWRGLDVVNAHEREPAAYVAGMRAAVEAVVEGRLDPAPLLTHRFPLERAAEAFDTAARRPDGFLKALVLAG